MSQKLVEVKALVPLHVEGKTIKVGEAVKLPKESVDTLVQKRKVEMIKGEK